MYGWLTHDPKMNGLIEGVKFDKVATKTRAEEYMLARDAALTVEGYRALDAATGYVPNWHVMPYILAKLSFIVDTIDCDPRTLDMPAHPHIVRQIGNIAAMPYDNAEFDLVCCISTLEHCPPAVREEFAKEAARVAKPGATILLTADNYPGICPGYLADLIKDDFDVGENLGDESVRFPGCKRVAFAVGTRKGTVRGLAPAAHG